jgi:hypothetical protein
MKPTVNKHKQTVNKHKQMVKKLKQQDQGGEPMLFHL